MTRRIVLTLLACGLALSAAPAHGAFPGANGKIAWSTTRVSPIHVFVMDADGTDETQISSGFFARNPEWSPDGQKIAFERMAVESDGDLEIAVMNADGSGVVDVTNNSTNEQNPTWSPDGQRIAFSSERGSPPNNDIYAINANGTDEDRLTTVAANDTQPAWSPDGQRIAFMSQRVGSGDTAFPQIFVMEADGDNQTQVTTTQSEHPSWSPDGALIAHVSGSSSFAGRVHVIKPDGTDRRAVTPDNGGDSMPVFSPDGTKIAYSNQAPGVPDTNIHVINLDGTGDTQLTDEDHNDIHPDWQPLPGSAAPAVTITSGPPATTSSRSARFEFAAASPNPPAGGFECRIDGSGDVPFTACVSPHEVSGFADGPRKFEVRFRPDDGEPGPISTHTWTVDGTGPGVVIDSAPSGSTDSPNALIEFRATEANVAFRCKVDGGTEFACTSPHQLSGLERGPHTFEVRAFDANGNPGVPVSVGWVVGCPTVKVGEAVGLGCFQEVEPGSGIFETTEQAWVGGFEIVPRSGGRLVLDTKAPALRAEGAGVDMLFAGFKVPIPVSLLPVGTPSAELELGGGGTVEGAILDLPLEAKFKVAWGDGGTSASYEQEVELEELTDFLGNLVTLREGEDLGDAGGSFKGKLENGKGFVLEQAEVKIDSIDVVPTGRSRALKLRNLLLKFELKDGKPLWTGQAGIALPLARGELTVTGRVFIFDGDLAGGGLEVDGLNRPLPPSPLVLQKVGGNLQFAPSFGFSLLVGADVGPRVNGKPFMTIDGTAAAGNLATASCSSGTEPVKLEFAGKLTPLDPLEQIDVAEAEIKLRSCLYGGSASALELAGEVKIDFLAGVLGYEGSQTGYVACDPAGCNAGLGSMSLEGDVELKLPGLPNPSGKGIISTKGIAACAELSFFEGGFGYLFGDPDPPTAFEGCDLGPYRVAPPATGGARVRAAAASRFRLPAGLPHVAFAATAADGPPQVKVSGPGFDAGRALVVPVEHERTTYVFVNDPRAGVWRVEPTDPAQALTRVRVSHGLEEPSVRTKLRRLRGGRMQLDYTVRPIAGQQVTFVERGDGASKVIGRARGRRGTLRFTPSLTGTRRRTIEAEVVQNGLPRETLTVARFTAPKVRLAKPRPKARRRGAALVLEWRAVGRAQRYLVEIRQGREPIRRMLTTKRKLRFGGLPAKARLTVLVRALNDALPPGPAARLTSRP